MADLDQQTEEALGWAAEGKKLAVDIPEVSFKDAATFVASATPIIGDAMAAKEVYDELQKDEPNYYLAGALGGAALVGLVPGLGDAAAKAIKKGATEVFDVAKRVEVDPNAMGSGLGNVRLKPKQDDVAEAASILESDEALSAWQQANKIPENKRQANTETAKAAAEDLYQGNITSKEARAIIKEDLPITSMYTAETMPSMPTVAQVAGSLGKKVQKTGVVGVKGFDIPAGTRVGSRLDIPAYNNYDTWVVSIHDGKNDTKGSVLGYGQAVRLKNIKFGSESQDALDIARGKARLRGAKAGTDTPEKPMGKATIARVYGDYVPEDPYALQEQARKLLSDPEWTQVGMNPYRQSNFYDKNTGLPVFEADEVIQVGPLVLAKGVKKPTKTQLKQLAVRTKDGKLRLFNEGGAVMNSSDNQMEMLFDEGGIADDGMNVDPVSGNEIPPGSMASEVRDDIPAQLSEGEYVVPADVLRFYGVKFFEDLRSEAKKGMAQMEADGRIGGEPVGMEDPRGAESALTPEEMAMLQEMGMAVGGMVPQPTQSTDPYMQQQRMYQQPSPVAMGNTGYSNGGLEDGTAPAFTQTTFDPSMYGAGFSFLSPSTPTETTPAPSTVMLYSPDGLTTQSFTLPAQQAEYDSKLAAGWSTTQIQTPQVTTQTGGNDDPPIKPETGEQGKKFSEMSGEELQNALNQNKKANAIMKGLVAVNPMLGLAGLGATKYAEKQILENMKKLGVKPVESDDPTVIENIANWIGDKFGTKDKEPTILKGIDTSIISAGATAAGAMSQEQVQAGIDYAAKGDDRDEDWDVGKVVENQTAPSTERTSEEVQAASQAAAEELGTTVATGGKAEGGLMQKKEKK
jgi:hypothetical protein